MNKFKDMGIELTRGVSTILASLSFGLCPLVLWLGRFDQLSLLLVLGGCFYGITLIASEIKGK